MLKKSARESLSDLSTKRKKLSRIARLLRAAKYEKKRRRPNGLTHRYHYEAIPSTHRKLPRRTNAVLAIVMEAVPSRVLHSPGGGRPVGGVDSRLNGIVGPMAKRSCRQSHWKAPNVRVGEGGALRSEMPVAKAENDDV